MGLLKLLLVDDHTLIRAGVRMLLENIEGVQVVAEGNNGRELLELVDSHHPDILLTDIAMPGLNGLEAMARLRKTHPTLRIMVLSMHTNEEYVRGAFSAGANAYLVKGADPAELEAALKAVAKGEVYLSPAISKAVVTQFLHAQPSESDGSKELTPRQREILQLIAEGQTTKEMARLLDLSIKTVETHRTELMNRLDIHDVAGLVRYAIRRGLISSET